MLKHNFISVYLLVYNISVNNSQYTDMEHKIPCHLWAFMMCYTKPLPLSIPGVSSVKTQLIYCQLKWQHVLTQGVIIRPIFEPCLRYIKWKCTFLGSHKCLQQCENVGTNEVDIYNIIYINPLKIKRRLLYLKPQSVLHSKHFSSRL